MVASFHTLPPGSAKWRPWNAGKKRLLWRIQKPLDRELSIAIIPCQRRPKHEVKRITTTEWISLCLYVSFLWRSSSHSRIIPWHGDDTFTVEGMHLLTYAWFGSEASIQWYDKSIRKVKDLWHSHTCCRTLGSESATVCFNDLYIRCVGTGIQNSRVGWLFLLVRRHISATSCQIIMSTYQIFMLICQLFMSTCQKKDNNNKLLNILFL